MSAGRSISPPEQAALFLGSGTFQPELDGQREFYFYREAIGHARSPVGHKADHAQHFCAAATTNVFEQGDARDAAVVVDDERDGHKTLNVVLSRRCRVLDGRCQKPLQFKLPTWETGRYLDIKSLVNAVALGRSRRVGLSRKGEGKAEGERQEEPDRFHVLEGFE